MAHSKAIFKLAGGKGFEPLERYQRSPVFKTGAFGHSANLPDRRSALYDDPVGSSCPSTYEHIILNHHWDVNGFFIFS